MSKKDSIWGYDNAYQGFGRSRRDENPFADEDIKPKTYYYHYSNDDSQGSLITCTNGFPTSKNRQNYEHVSAYSDRLSQWDYDHFKKLCELIGTGDQGWPQRLQGMNDDKLKEIAQFAFNLEHLPDHVRAIHYFNVSNGYSCPVIECLYKKGTNRIMPKIEEKQDATAL